MFRCRRGSADGQRITVQDGRLDVPDRPIIPYIIGAGIGTGATAAMQAMLDAAAAKGGGGKSIAWVEVYAGERASAARN